MNLNWQKIKWLGLGLLTLITIFVWVAIWQLAPSPKMSVAFLDVGQGDAILIDTPHHRQVLLDTGPGSAVLPSLGQAMPFFDHSLDLILLSHGDSDHSGGLSDVLSHYSLDYFLAGNWAIGNKKVIGKNDFLSAEAGTRIELEPNIFLDVIEGGTTNKKDNVDSLVARLSYGSTTFLLTGDSVSKEETDEINKLGDYLQADVLKVSHHGSRTSTSGNFLVRVRPPYAVISVGADNRYGHPTAETLERLKKIGAEILRTDEQGTIVFESDGQKIIKK
ncbi:MAG: ComEC/Rec2 family competence protein [Candidatus Paceibacterota bacterium]|jgi:beta-lactamase superfamily II metal-dependent hydrolase